MEKFENVLIGIDNTTMDHDLVRAANVLCRFSSIKNVRFLHVIKDTFLSKSLLNEFPTLLEDAIKERKVKLEVLLAELSANHPTKNITLEVIEGVPNKIISKKIEAYNTDLLVVGAKRNALKKETIVKTLVKKVDCSMLIIPEGVKNLELKRLLVPIDFTKGAHTAMGLAASIANNELKDAEILTQNIFSVPTGYHYTGKSFEEFAEIMKQNAIQDYNNFISDITLDLSRVKNIYTLDKKEDLIGIISSTAEQMKVDAIIIGARVKTASSAFFSGCSAEKLLHKPMAIPVFIIKTKGKSANFLEYLKEI